MASSSNRVLHLARGQLALGPLAAGAMLAVTLALAAQAWWAAKGPAAPAAAGADTTDLHEH